MRADENGGAKSCHFRGDQVFGVEDDPRLIAAQETEIAIDTHTAAPIYTPAYTPAPTLGVVSSMVSEKDGMTLVYVPEGEFLR